MNSAQYKNFTEKKIKRTGKGRKFVSYSNEEKTIIITILIALMVMGALLIKLVVTPIETEPFSAIYYLDAEKQTTNIPKTVVLGTNNTFRLYVGVQNQNGTTQNGTRLDYRNYVVYLKVDDGKGQVNPSLIEPLKSFENSVKYEDVWEFEVIININQKGNNRVIFELWYLNPTSLKPEYTGNWVNLSIEAY